MTSQLRLGDLNVTGVSLWGGLPVSLSGKLLESSLVGFAPNKLPAISEANQCD